MASQVQLEIRKLGFFGLAFRFIFYTFNVIMLVVLISVFRSMPDTSAQTSAEQVGAAVGTGIGVGLYLIVWAAGAVILGLPVLITRGQKMLAPIDAPEAVAFRRRQWIMRGTATVIGLVLFFIFQQADKSSKATSPASSDAASEQTKRPETFVKIANFAWAKDGFGSVMTADFSLRNDLPWPVKDITIRCDHAAPSGTTIDQNTRTIYERIEPGSTKQIRQFNMGFINSQATKSGCSVTKVVVLR